MSSSSLTPSSMNELELGRHRHCPQQVGQTLGGDAVAALAQERGVGGLVTRTLPAGALSPARSPAASRGISEDSATLSPLPVTKVASAQIGRRRSGAFEPSSWTSSHRADAFETSMSNALAVAARPATVLLNRLAGPGGSSPSSRRAPRDNRRA